MQCKRTYSSGYYDPLNFRSLIEYFTANGPIIGAILIFPGGAFQFRSMTNEGYNVANRLVSLGYQCFVARYRLRPYIQQEGAFDLQRYVRYVRKNENVYGIDPNNIFVVGFSAGGILCGELCLNWKGLKNARSHDPYYILN